LTALASSLVDWSALWKIVVAALVGGTGVVLVFGVMLYGLQRFQTAKHLAGRIVNATVVGAAGAFCIAAVVIGIVAMTHKSSPKTSHGGKAVKTAAHVQLSE
jgi:NADH:ubiquinone oxidoreductase subunit 6 (subunit J)